MIRVSGFLAAVALGGVLPPAPAGDAAAAASLPLPCALGGRMCLSLATLRRVSGGGNLHRHRTSQTYSCGCIWAFRWEIPRALCQREMPQQQQPCTCITGRRMCT